MAPERRSRLVALAALVVLFAAVVGYQWWGRPSSIAAPASNERGASRTAPRGAAAAQEAPDVHLPQLSADRPKPTAGERNLFRFRTRAAPPAPAQPDHPVTTPQQPPPVFNTTPPIVLRYIGFIAQGNGKPKIVSFVDATGHPINCIEGADCDGRYHIWRVGAESVEISYLDGSGRRTIRQGGG